MKRRLIFGTAIAAAVIAVGMCGVANADGYQSPRAAYVAPDSWSGLYAGASVGGVWTTLQNQIPKTDDFFAGGSRFDLSTANVVTGGHVGYQQQWGGLVAGIELAASFYHDMEDRARFVTSPPCEFAALGNGRPCGLENRVEWSAQAVGRLGIAAGAFLPYVKGGWAIVDINSREVNCCIPTTVVSNAFSNPAEFSRDDKVHSGWVAGGGVEWRLSKQVLLGVDYQHIFVNDGFHSSPCEVSPPLSTCTIHFGNVRINGDLDQVTARLSFLFGREPAAAPLK